MILLASLLVLLGGEAVTKIPGGAFDLPIGCTGPSEIVMGLDAFMGYIYCSKNGDQAMLVEGGAAWGPTCTPKAGFKDLIILKSRAGATLTICYRESKPRNSQQVRREMIVDLGPGQLIAELKGPRDAIIALQVVSGFRLRK